MDEANEPEKILQRAVVVFLVAGYSIWLGHKTRSIGKGCRVGPGGGIEKGETAVAAAVRETEEETGLVIAPERFEYVGYLLTHNTTADGQKFDCAVAIFRVRVGKNEVPTPQRSQTHPEQEPPLIDFRLYSAPQVPTQDIMLMDQLWFDYLQGNQKFTVEGTYGPRQKTLIGEVLVCSVDILPQLLSKE